MKKMYYFLFISVLVLGLCSKAMLAKAGEKMYPDVYLNKFATCSAYNTTHFVNNVQVNFNIVGMRNGKCVHSQTQYSIPSIKMECSMDKVQQKEMLAQMKSSNAGSKTTYGISPSCKVLLQKADGTWSDADKEFAKAFSSHQ